MSIEKEIYLRLYISEVASDILTKCNAMAESFEGTDKDYPYINEYLRHPDGTENKPIISRGLEEAMYNIRIIMQRYLVAGTTVDENLLRALWSKDKNGKEVRVNIELGMPKDFNIAVTKSLAVMVHEYLTDFIIYRYLYPRLSEVATGWKAIADIVLSEIKECLNSRVVSVRRSPSWV